jgi:hypothetical protein
LTGIYPNPMLHVEPRTSTYKGDNGKPNPFLSQAHLYAFHGIERSQLFPGSESREGEFFREAAPMPLACRPPILGDSEEKFVVNGRMAEVLARFKVKCRPFRWAGFFRSGTAIGETKEAYYLPKRGQPLAAFEPLPPDVPVPPDWHGFEPIIPSTRDFPRDELETWIVEHPINASPIETCEQRRHELTPRKDYPALVRTVFGVLVRRDLFRLIYDAFPSHYWVVLRALRKADPIG